MKNLKVKTLAKRLKKTMNQVESDENHSQNTILFWSLAPTEDGDLPTRLQEPSSSSRLICWAMESFGFYHWAWSHLAFTTDSLQTCIMHVASRILLCLFNN
jgi:hypothetical protein